jgi:hypothetical protein
MYYFCLLHGSFSQGKSFIYLVVLCSYILKDSLGFSRTTTFSDVGRAAFGKLGIILVQVSLIGYSLGACCSYMLFVSQSLEVFFQLFINLYENINKVLVPEVVQELWALILIGFFLLMSFVRSLKATAFLSFFANIAIALGFISLVVFLLFFFIFVLIWFLDHCL